MSTKAPPGWDAAPTGGPPPGWDNAPTAPPGWDNAGSSGSSGDAYDFEKTKELLLTNGAKPEEAEMLSHVARAESSYNPDAMNSYQEGGKTYHPQGLFQISDINGPENYRDPQIGARKAIEMYRAHGLSPWEDSRNKGGGGGWGQYATSDSREAQFRNASGGAPKTPETGVVKPFSHVPSDVPKLAGFVPSAQEAGNALKSAHKVESKISHPAQQLVNKGVWDYFLDPVKSVAKNTAEAFTNVETTFGQRQIGRFTADLLAGKNLTTSLSEAFKETLHPEDEQKITQALEVGLHAKLRSWGLPASDDPEHENKILHAIEDIGVEMLTDPLTYVPIADVVKFAGMAASHAGGAIHAEEMAKTLLAQADKSKFTKLIADSMRDATHSTLSGMKVLSEKTGQLFKEKRKDLDPWFTPEGKMGVMAIQHAADQAKTELAIEHARSLGGIKDVLKKNTYADVVHPEIRKMNLREQWRYGDAAARLQAEHFGYIADKADQKIAAQQGRGMMGTIGGGGAPGYIRYSKMGKPMFAVRSSDLTLKGPLGDAMRLYKAHPDAFRLVPRKNPNPDLAGLSQYDIARARGELMRWTVAREQSAHFTDDLMTHNPALLYAVPKHDGITRREWLAKNVRNYDTSATSVRRVTKGGQIIVKANSGPVFGGELPGVRPLANLWRQGIMANPLPHGLGNVLFGIGWMRGGPQAVSSGLGHAGALFKAEKLGLSGERQALLDRVTAMGARTSFWKEPGGLAEVAGFKQYLGMASNVMDHLETGARMARLEAMDKLYGPSKTIEEELKKGYQIAEDMGNYKDATDFVKILHNLGGVFVNFRGDIAPRATFHAVWNQGLFASQETQLASRIPRSIPFVPIFARTENALNNDVKPSGSQYKEKLAGPAADALDMVGNPVNFFSSPSTVGPLASSAVSEVAALKTGDIQKATPDIEKNLNQYAAQMLPGSSMLEASNPHLFSPYGGPKNPPLWLIVFHELFGGYEQQKPGKSILRKYKTESSLGKYQGN